MAELQVTLRQSGSRVHGRKDKITKPVPIEHFLVLLEQLKEN